LAFVKGFFRRLVMGQLRALVANCGWHVYGISSALARQGTGLTAGMLMARTEHAYADGGVGMPPGEGACN
jgi:hypothetical protein